MSRHRLARMTMIPGSGTKFLAEHRDLKEWPDLDVDVLDTVVEKVDREPGA